MSRTIFRYLQYMPPGKKKHIFQQVKVIIPERYVSTLNFQHTLGSDLFCDRSGPAGNEIADQFFIGVNFLPVDEKRLTEIQNNKNVVKLKLQPAEQIPGGAFDMVRSHLRFLDYGSRAENPLGGPFDIIGPRPFPWKSQGD